MADHSRSGPSGGHSRPAAPYNLNEASNCALELLLNHESLPDLPEEELNSLLASGYITPSTAHAIFGEDAQSLPAFDGTSQHSEKEMNLLKSLSQSLSERRRSLIKECQDGSSRDRASKETPIGGFPTSSLPDTETGSSRSSTASSAFFSTPHSQFVASGTGKQRALEFDPEEMMVEDLRQECKLRGLPTSGPKVTLVKRLVQAVADRPELSLRRLTMPAQKRKRTMNKREPQRSHFASEEDYQDAWQKWRASRDHNNESVKRSRENARQKKEEHEKLCKARERENMELTDEVQRLRDQVVFLTKVLKNPSGLNDGDKSRVQQLMSTLGKPQ